MFTAHNFFAHQYMIRPTYESLLKTSEILTKEVRDNRKIIQSLKEANKELARKLSNAEHELQTLIKNRA